MYTFKFADIGEGIHEGKIAEIFVKEGDSVNDGTDLFLVETDKVTTEVASPVKGIITKILFKVGDTVHVGQPLFEINDSDSSSVVPKVEQPAPQQSAPVEAPKAQEEQAGASVVGEVKVSNSVLPLFGSNAKSVAVQEKFVNKNVTASPLARMIAKEKGIDLGTVKGSGPLGRVLVADLEKLSKPVGSSSSSLHSQVADSVSACSTSASSCSTSKHEPVQTPVSAPKTESGDVKVEMSSIRKAISKAMKESWSNVAYTNLSTEIDVTELWDQRNKIKDSLLKNEGIKLNLLPFIIKAVAKAMKKYPNFNALIDETTNSLVLKKEVNIGIAVDTKDGLIVPNIKDVNNLSIVEISKQISDLAERARNKKIQLSDLSGGTVSVTNYGSLGVSFGVPVIKYPEVAIIGIGSLESKVKKIGFLDRPLPDKHVVERKVMYLTMAADHRWVDGGDIARFLSLVKEYLENFALLFI
ncbi:MAG: 2-oxo acid dehydrogenase subunit E2 [Malacoplasma sp.]|nr:2-oxo acid dehydrogenase subunit E2 [Malacoplasma sp.]